jgi:hypothetical protein
MDQPLPIRSNVVMTQLATLIVAAISLLATAGGGLYWLVPAVVLPSGSA